MRAGALEVGGTHVAAAVVDVAGGACVSGPARLPVDSHGPAESVLAVFTGAATGLGAEGGLAWGVAMPEPFDYAAGVAWFRGVRKYEALYGVDIRAALAAELPAPRLIHFLNDADAFAIGEAHSGAARGASRCVGITLGSGIGSGWVVDGRAVDQGPGVPPDGRARHLTVDGRGLEDLVSRQPIRDAYARATGGGDADVREIAGRARDGQPAAVRVLRDAFTALGRGLAPGLREFAPDVLVVGGSMAASWDLFEPWFRAGLGGLDVPVRVSEDGERAALLGAARSAYSALSAARRSGSADASPGAANA